MSGEYYCPCGSCQSARAWASVDRGMLNRGTSNKHCEVCDSYHESGFSNCPLKCRSCDRGVVIKGEDYCSDCYS